ncbi:dihydrofolate reductase family protein [Streptomyces sp. NPDC003720]|uniref:dihydrofolate reductase family protein n=1 Tax=Streptomyces sp. NPDC003720 TaxID=3364684 RepID=UPI0036B3DDEB
MITGEDIAGQTRALKHQPGGNIKVGGSITLVQWLMSNGLLDDLYLQIAPVIAGTSRTATDPHAPSGHPRLRQPRHRSPLHPPAPLTRPTPFRPPATTTRKEL